MSEPKIYVACLAAYNNGYLHGAWIDADDDINDIWDAINKMLSKSPIENAEEYAIHDYEDFAGYRVSEYEGIEHVNQVALFLTKHGDFAIDVLDYCGDDFEQAEKMIEENYSGCYSSVAEYAEQLTEDITQIPQHLQYYIDYDKMARDMELNGDIFTIETAHDEVHVFWSH